ncbi:Gag-Pol polyprotein [Diplonema papillatum]|nr:Gag-Pol polyprotein [Diplonema papillatum]KAJ9445129.1 Gag-Pol polyprotein [Diplonema papillatum]KAJ9446262.1 Gag-Pol polyprotein [Diplonema papillatum]KAJ9446527.1 Gag-Pol polyprotein [Diplonema papillatum]KAJ9451299.1 Gag-Pol polyprotein [Diplonema papillatum]
MFTPFVGVAYGGELLINNLTAVPTQRRIGEALAPISSSFMNLERLTALDSRGLLRGVLDVVRSWESFRSALLPGAEEALMASAITRTTSRRMLRHFPDLVRYGVAEVASGGLRVVLPAFTVDKKSGGQRFVCDGRKLNAIMARPPPMLLPSVHEVIDRVLASSVVFLADARSYFYQFRLDADIRPYFGMHLAGPRGRFVQAQLAAMCMGWSWAPAIAQRASRVLLPEADGLPWVDNFVVVGSSLREATSRFDSFVQRCRDVNCELNEDDEQFGAPLREFDLLGLHFELSRFDRPARYRMAESWVSKLLGSPELAMVRLGGVSPRQFYRVFGSLVWFAYTTRFRLAYARCSLSFLQRLASTLASDPAAWDVTRAVPPSTVREVEHLVSLVEENRWVSRSESFPSSVTLWTDASSKWWAAVLEGESERVSQGPFVELSHTHIFLKELFAVLRGIEMTASFHSNVRVRLMVDNLPAVHCLNKGHSKNFAANVLLTRIFDAARAAGLVISAEWVPTDAQRADPYTRGVLALVSDTPESVWSPHAEDLAPPSDLVCHCVVPGGPDA